MTDFESYRDKIVSMLPDVRQRVAVEGKEAAARGIADFLFVASLMDDPRALPGFAAAVLVAFAIETRDKEVRGG